MADLPKPRRRFRVLLAASLALNLLFVGLIAGAVWRHGGAKDGDWKRGAPGLDRYGAAYVRALPQADRRALHQSLRAARTEGRKGRAAQYQQMLALLRADPFDATAAREILDSQKDWVLRGQGAAHDTWLARINGMTPAQRLAYADRLQEVLENRQRHKQKHNR